jgi:hypothetical protein
MQGGTSVGHPTLLRTLLCAFFALSASAATVLGQKDPGGLGTGSFFGSSRTENCACPPAADPLPATDGGGPCACPRWTASAELIGLCRVGGANQTLVSTYPPHTPIILGTGTEWLNSRDLDQGFAAGPRVGLVRHGDCGCDVEFSFFAIDGWNSYGRIDPNGSMLPNWLVFTAPGDFVQLTDYPDQAMAWSYATKLYSAELNLRWDLCPRVTMLAGFRWANLTDDLEGTLPPQRHEPFWDTRTRNNLYGLQVGEDWKILNWGRFSLDGLVKAGVFDNHAEEATEVSIDRRPYRESASTDQLAFLGEIGVQCRYQLTQRLLLKAGYEAIWLQGVALAPAQIRQTFCNGTPASDIYVQALGLDSGSGVFFHGATAGLEYAY